MVGVEIQLFLSLPIGGKEIDGKMFMKHLRLGFLLIVIWILESGLFACGLANDHHICKKYKKLENISLCLIWSKK